MQTLTAEQIGNSFGAYSGRPVSFTTQGIPVAGVLDYSDKSQEGPWAFLKVAGELHCVNNDVLVEVA